VNPSEGVERALVEAELEHQVAAPGYWFVPFEQPNGTPIRVMILADDAKEYVTIASPLRLSKSPESFSREILMELLAISTFIPLAKLEVAAVEGKLWLAATSECAYEGLNGKKLRRRLEACANLAGRIRKVLDGHDLR
jgi:hypothetical protein